MATTLSFHQYFVNCIFVVLYINSVLIKLSKARVQRNVKSSLSCYFTATHSIKLFSFRRKQRDNHLIFQSSMAPFRIYQQSKQKCSSKSMQIGNDFSYEIVRIGKKLKSLTIEAPILEVFHFSSRCCEITKMAICCPQSRGTNVLKCLSAEPTKNQIC